jgi:hypothetical protein
MKWSTVRMELVACLIVFMQILSFGLHIHGSKIGTFFSYFWTFLIFLLVWYALIKRVEINKLSSKEIQNE